ncbi:hypothetical protein GT354_15385, partial [Streptomyces sp. SID3343]|nr:hypothetical protein [Streptomyces sp. SID3343]
DGCRRRAPGRHRAGRGEFWWPACVVALAVEAANALWLRGREPGVPEIAALSIPRRVKALGESARAGRWAEAVRFVTGLRSAWWVARAAVVGLAVGVLGGGAVWGVVAGVAALSGSLWLGPRSTGDRRLLWAAIPVNLLVVGLGIGVVWSGELSPDDHYVYRESGSSGPAYYPSGSGGYGDSDTGEVLMTTTSGRRVENIYPFDSQGRPLKDVLLFDQNGKQLGLAPGEYDAVCARINDGKSVPLVESRTRLPFPQPRVVRDPTTGQCRVETGVPFTIAIPVQSGQATSAPQTGQAPQSTQGPQSTQAPQSTAPPAASSAPQSGQPTSPTTAPVSPLGEAPPAATPGAPNGS